MRIYFHEVTEGKFVQFGELMRRGQEILDAAIGEDVGVWVMGWEY